MRPEGEAPQPQLLSELLTTAVRAADPAAAVARALPSEPPGGRVVVIGAGKASGRMAEGLERAWPDADLSGAVAVPPGTPAHCRRIALLQASHPVPDEHSVSAARRVREAVQGLGATDHVIALISGGGSALLCEPLPGIDLATKQAITRELLASGASIAEINAVRQRLSGIKGGRLAEAAAPAAVHTLIVSDIPGDHAHLVASGPTLPSPFGPDRAQAVLRRYGIDVPPAAREAMEANPPPDADAIGSRCSHEIVCSAMQSLEAAAARAREAGYTPHILGDGLEGEAREMARVHGGIAQSVRAWGQPVSPPAVLLSGGEATVTLGDAPGRGGRNTEFALALALYLAGAPGIHALAADTDGIDGNGEHAGGRVGPDSLDRARAEGLDPHAALAEHRSAELLEAIGELLDTGPTGTNVNDFRAILVD